MADDTQLEDDSERATQTRYAAGAVAVEAALCCPTSYDPRFLEVIPAEVIERDYGCGDPSRYLAEGETVLDLGSGTGKICFIASQVVGPKGHVIGVDMTDAMLQVARDAAPVVAERIGYTNVSFLRGRIQDLALDLDWLDARLAETPVRSNDDLVALSGAIASARQDAPLVADHSVDVVVSNCVLNLVRSEDKASLFDEIYRVLRKGGRAVISDIVGDEEVPSAMQADPELWSGCISGALREDLFIKAFEDAGFHGIEVLERQAEPWRVVEGIEFRSLTVAAYKGKAGPCLERGQAVIYKGPFKEALDDDGHLFPRGQAVAVCAKTFGLLGRAPYQGQFTLLEPAHTIVLEDAKPFPCGPRTLLRSARELKGAVAIAGLDGEDSASCCAPADDGGASCC